MRIPERAPRDEEEIAGYLAAFTNYEKQQALPTHRRTLGPGRAAQLLDRLGLLPMKHPVVQVAGSKGKGSTVLWLDALLRQRGLRPGCYLSPHLESIFERIRIDGRNSTASEVLVGLDRIHPHLVEVERRDPAAQVTFFDLWTCLAALTFHETNCDYSLFEVGLGGPLDSTTAVPHDVGVLTTVDLEHCAQLGNTEPEIAQEKSGIARADRPFVIAEPQSEAGRAAIATAEERGAALVLVDEGNRLGHLTLSPPHGTNLSTALAVLEVGFAFSPYSDQELRAVLQNTHPPGRLEVLPGPPELLLDGAHTIRSLRLFRSAFDRWRGDRPATILVSFLEGKNWEDALAVFAPDETVRWIITTPNSSRRLNPTELASYLKSISSQVTIEEDPGAAVTLLRNDANAGRACAATGSMHLAGFVRSAWARK